MNKNARSILVSYTCNDDIKSAVLLVGEKKPGKDVAIVNAFQGTEAYSLWQKLTVKKEN